MNFYDLLVEREKVFGQKIFLQVDEEIFTYAKFLSEVERCEGAEIFIAEKNFVSQAIKFFAAQKFNKKPVLLHENLTSADINFSQGGAEDIFGVLTSGTTGKPKILYRTYESWADFFPTQNKIFKIDSTTKIFLHGSLSFTGNLNVMLAVLFAGGTILTCKNFGRQSWQKNLRQATNIYLVPTKLRFLTQGEPLKNICGIFTGSQVLTAAQSLSLQKKFPCAEIILYYGASELNYISYKKISAENISEVQNLGKPFDGVKVEIIGGKIFVENKFHVSGIKIPYSVGDCGHFDAAGNIIFEGRGEDFINRGGVKISAANIEEKILQIPEVKAAAVVKFVDDVRGEDFKIFLESSENVRKKIREKLLPVEMPAEIIFIKKIPLNDRGKIDRQKLFDCYGGKNSVQF